MLKGLDTFKEYFGEYADQYVLVGGAACDISFESNDLRFRATRDLDMVLIVEALTKDFSEQFFEFVEAGGYRNKASSIGKPQFYRFDKPKDASFPKMIELFSRTEFELANANGLTPVHIDDEASSLSAILLDDDYYRVLLDGKTVVNGLSVLRPEHLILFKAKAFLDLKSRKESGESVDSSNISKHKKDIFRIVAELRLNRMESIPTSVREDVIAFIDSLAQEPIDDNSLRNYGLKNDEVVDRLKKIFE